MKLTGTDIDIYEFRMIFFGHSTSSYFLTIVKVKVLHMAILLCAFDDFYS